MTAENELGSDIKTDPRVSTLAYFGTELRIKREQADLSQGAFAQRMFCDRSHVSRIESAERVPTEDFAERCDEVLGTGGTFARLWPVVIEHAYPDWFRPFVEMEQDAREIWDFENQVVPGLLQTEEYARAVFGATRLPHAKELVAARMTRQQVLNSGSPPEIWAIFDESVLRRPVGGPEVMRQQLAQLLEFGENPHVVFQVLAYEAQAHAGLAGAFAGLTLDQGPNVVYMDGVVRGHVLADAESVRAARRTYDLLRADALSPRASLDVIAAAAKDFSS